MISSSTFSLDVESYTYTWKVSNLIDHAKNIDIVDWVIPESFSNNWSWGSDSLEEHLERCINADIEYPIIVWDNLILDGVHRTIKTIAMKKNTVKAKIIKDIPPPDLIEELTNKKLNNHNNTFKEMIDLVESKINSDM